MRMDAKRFTIAEAARVTGLPASTLRYYEQIGIIAPIDRESTGHRTYSQEDVDLIGGIACLSATGMSIPQMREYLAHRLDGAEGAAQEIALLESQQVALEREAHSLSLKQEYVRLKIAYWRAVEKGDDAEAASIAQATLQTASEIRAAQ